jgi:hypothetical protein
LLTSAYRVCNCGVKREKTKVEHLKFPWNHPQTVPARDACLAGVQARMAAAAGGGGGGGAGGGSDSSSDEDDGGAEAMRMLTAAASIDAELAGVLASLG